MSARHLDPIVWAAAYGAAFAKRHTIGDVEQGMLDTQTAIAFADAAVVALHPDAHGETPEAAEAHDVAWARLVKAVETRWREDIQGAAQVDYLREIDASKDALRALGVGEDLLSAGAP